VRHSSSPLVGFNVSGLRGVSSWFFLDHPIFVSGWYPLTPSNFSGGGAAAARVGFE
jgi:hypothetical protein